MERVVAADERNFPGATALVGLAGRGRTRETGCGRVNRAQSAAEEAAMGVSIGRGRPLGEAEGVVETARRMGVEHTLRVTGRPGKKTENDS